MWRRLVAKHGTYTSGCIWWPKLEVMQVLVTIFSTNKVIGPLCLWKLDTFIVKLQTFLNLSDIACQATLAFVAETKLLVYNDYLKAAQGI